MVDPLTITLVSTIELGSGDLDDVVPLSEYKFNKSHLAVVKQTPKHQKILVGGLEKPITEGFQESTIWNIEGQDITQVGVETFTVIVRLALFNKHPLKPWQSK